MAYLIAFWLLWHSSPGSAQVFKGPISSALGGTGVAGMDGPEAGLLNPALVPISASGASAYFQDGDVAVGQHSQGAALGALDNGPGIWFPGALHYLQLRDTGLSPVPANRVIWDMAIGERLGDFAFGVSGDYIQDTLTSDGLRFTQWNFTLGGLYMVNPGMGFAYVLRNVAGVGGAVPAGLRLNMEQVVGAFAGFGDVARVRFDIGRDERLNPDHKLSYRMGLESKTGTMLVMRLGYRYDDLNTERVITAGLGFDGPKLKANYSIEKNQNGIPGALHSVDLSLPF